jgi:hypothetical protein
MPARGRPSLALVLLFLSLFALTVGFGIRLPDPFVFFRDRGMLAQIRDALTLRP